MMIGFRNYQPPDHDYWFIYPSWWHRQLVNGPCLDGLVISLNKIEDSTLCGDKGGYIVISIYEAENSAETVEDYIQILQDTEKSKIKSGIFPIVPGPSQYELLVSEQTYLAGFEEVSSLYSLGSYNEAHEYWNIVNNKLYIIRYEYSEDEKQKIWFEFGKNIIFWTFKLF